MTDQRKWYAGIDWASASHHVVLTDDEGQKVGERVFKPFWGRGVPKPRECGEGLAAMAAWLLAWSGAADASLIQVAIEVPHGPVVKR